MNKKSFIVLLISLLALPMMSQNPFFKKATTPYGTFPFNQLKTNIIYRLLKKASSSMPPKSIKLLTIKNNRHLPIRLWLWSVRVRYFRVCLTCFCAQ